jgi:hypothetical protein
MKPAIVSLMGSLAFALVSTPSVATKVQLLTLSQINTVAESVVVGVVTTTSTRADADRKMVWTDYQLTIQETLRGPRQDATMRVSFAGGTTGGLSIGIVGSPRLEQGKRYVLFLFPQSSMVSATVGWGQGIFRVEDVTVGTTPKTVLISYDLQPLELDQQGRLFRGTPVENRGGQLRSMEPPVQEFPRASEPTVYDAQGRPVPQPPQQAAVAPSAVTDRSFATLDDLRQFVRRERQEAPAVGK